jgi:uncharacterized protein YerC
VGLGTATTSIDADSYRSFRRQLTVPVDQALQQHARVLLAAHGITEPLTWQPPLEWAPQAEWLAPDPESLDLQQILWALHAEHATASTVAQRLSVSIGHIRYVTDRHPVDATCLSWALPPAAAIKRRNHVELPPAYLRQRYETDEWTYAQIAAETGISKTVVRAHAHRAGIRSRPPRPRSQVDLDPEWIAREYVENKRTLKELAVEAGTSPTTLARIAKAAGIPIRPRGGRRQGGRFLKAGREARRSGGASRHRTGAPCAAPATQAALAGAVAWPLPSAAGQRPQDGGVGTASHPATGGLAATVDRAAAP